LYVSLESSYMNPRCPEAYNLTLEGKIVNLGDFSDLNIKLGFHNWIQTYLTLSSCYLAQIKQNKLLIEPIAYLRCSNDNIHLRWWWKMGVRVHNTL